VQKHKKRVEHLHGHPPKLERAKMEVGEEWRRKSAASACQETQFSWSCQLCHHYLQNCHSTTQNYKNARMDLKCWPIHLDDVEMMWKW